MAVLVREKQPQVRYSLSRRTLIGRSHLAHIRLTGRGVSSEHAVIYFDRGSWKVRDLASRNGTFVRGERIPPGEARILEQMDRISIGGEEDRDFCMASVSPPGPAAIGPDGELVEASEGALWLPSPEAAELCVVSQRGEWVVVGPSGERGVELADEVTCGGVAWALCLPVIDQADLDEGATTQDNHALVGAYLKFSVSMDEEHVALALVRSAHRTNLGARAFNRALLLLAQRRCSDAASGLVDSEAGWVYSDELQRDLRLSREALNLQLWRATQCFAKLRLPGGVLVERRRDTQQVRIGFPCHILGVNFGR
jgi:hypothetical protein